MDFFDENIDSHFQSIEKSTYQWKLNIMKFINFRETETQNLKSVSFYIDLLFLWLICTWILIKKKTKQKSS